MQNGKASLLIELAVEAGVELSHTQDRKAFGTIPVDGHRETWPLDSRPFHLWLRHRFYQSTKSALPRPALKEAVETLESQAVFESPECAVFCRFAERNGTIYLDLANERWEAAAITQKGWTIMDVPPVKFHRPQGMAPLPHPVPGGDIQELREFVNVASDRDWILVTAWLIAAFQPTGPYPILILHGEQGTAKSYCCRVLRKLVDPHASPLRSMVREERDLMIMATNAWVLAFDNLSHLSPWMSDALCRLATGGGFGTRRLYTDRDEILFHAQRPVMLNGIEDLATRGDLLDRSVVLHLPLIPEHKRQDEKRFWHAFEAARPRILGALLDAVTTALRELPHIKPPTLPRMADFALWSCATASACGWDITTEQGTVVAGAEAFLHAYAGNREMAHALALEASDVAQAVQELVERVGQWRGTAIELLDVLRTTVAGSHTRNSLWPRSAGALSGMLRRLAPNLRTVGVYIEFIRQPGGKRRLITLYKEGGR